MNIRASIIVAGVREVLLMLRSRFNRVVIIRRFYGEERSIDVIIIVIIVVHIFPTIISRAR